YLATQLPVIPITASRIISAGDVDYRPRGSDVPGEDGPNRSVTSTRPRSAHEVRDPDSFQPAAVGTPHRRLPARGAGLARAGAGADQRRFRAVAHRDAGQRRAGGW